MNWTQFLLALAALYLSYYLLNIIFDLLRTAGPPSQDALGQELVFSEEILPEEIPLEMDDVPLQGPQIEEQTRQSISSGPLQSPGAVGISELLGLAKAGRIEYTKTIPY